MKNAKFFFQEFYTKQRHYRQPNKKDFQGQQGESVRRVLLAMHAQTKAGAIEKPALRVKPCGSHGVVKGVDLIVHMKRLIRIARDLPLAFIHLMDRNGFAALFGL